MALKIKGQSKKLYGEIVRFSTLSTEGADPKGGEVHLLLAGAAPGSELAVYSTRMLDSKVSDSAWKKVVKELEKSLPAQIAWVKGHDAPAGSLTADKALTDVAIQIQNAAGGSVSKVRS